MQALILLGAHHLVAATIGFVAGLIANFALHTRVTFSARYSRGVLFKFLIVVLINYLITIAFVWSFNATLNMAVLGKVVSLPLIAVNGFLLSKFWVYK